MSIYQEIEHKFNENKKMFGVLIDPGKQEINELLGTIEVCNSTSVDFLFVGGSLITSGNFSETVKFVKENSHKPVIIFPGSPEQVSSYADAILFLSLISGRNPELLIGNQVTAAPWVKKASLEVIPMGYLLVDCGTKTTAISVSETDPILYNESSTAAATALAGEYLGMKLIYIDGGSGAKKNISPKMVSLTKENISIPLIIGGGITTSDIATEIYEAGADIIIVGNGAEKNRNLISEIAEVKDRLNDCSSEEITEQDTATYLNRS